jgi:hypothetical protein
MAEYIWKDKVKVITREWTRGELLEFWGRIIQGGDLQPLVDSATWVDEGVLREHVAAQSTAEIHVRNGNGWKRVTEPVTIDGFTLLIPASQTMFADMPVSLVDGWIAAAEEENGELSAILNFTSRGRKNGLNGSEIPSGSEPSAGF